MAKLAKIRIGCASGFWGDTEAAAEQLITGGNIDFLVFDYLAEITMSILSRAKAKDPSKGYAVDFVNVLTPQLVELKNRKIRVVSNAGGLNPWACRDAIEAKIRDAKLDIKVAVVDGDDLIGRLEWLKQRSITELDSGRPLPRHLQSANAYLGAAPIVAALDHGADIVITGRCVDSAVVLAPLVHHFGWSWDDYDKLAQGSLAGHIIECGTQATGGLFTDWKDVPGWDNMGFPIVECEEDGSFIITKPPETGGLVTPPTVAEQIVYEIGDPQSYILPDVICDFSQVVLAEVGRDRVQVTGAKGRAPTEFYKVCATYAEGFRITGTMMIGGDDAVAKGERLAAGVLSRIRRMYRERGFADFSETNVEIIGAEAMYGPHTRARAAREVIVKLAARHDSKQALDLLSREWYPAAAAMAQGISGLSGGRPSAVPVVRLFSFLIPKTDVVPSVRLGDAAFPIETHVAPAGSVPDRPEAPRIWIGGARTEVPLIRIAYGRSGDKGDMSNIGLIARHPELYESLVGEVTVERVAEYLAHLVSGQVDRYLMPGFCAVNFLLARALGGGGVASLRYDPQGKAFAQMLLSMPVKVSLHLLDR